ncbi:MULTISPECIES: ABC transporter ATP-binding protein [Lachnospira]|jgi:ABC-2 type transport system ATP-binding protein|uniref:ATP-binding cassette domain-containing protein n=2 Tax=Lachnospira TaxID=28050 RepID=A0ABR7G0F2_9FIRM|nr:ATP-binding cassette domain-containing protein [Lachnospira hominis]MBC5680915.1 ATP-binding cassette domain-containing protein [Lachnospira hominis]MBO6175665.1 ATP-binding cassette domain-containing protein [Lachnospira sp.]CCX82543.1 sodium transport system ATP-binding protein [Eubacterium sp. CAG:86]
MKLEVKDITKSFGDKQVLHGISFEVQSGRALGLLGRNGAGKTTTIRILMDVFRANSGEVLLDGEKFNQRKHLIGYLPEERGLYPKKKVIEQMVYLGRIRGISKSEAVANSKKWLKRLGVLEYENAKLETLSKGNQQKVQLASTLVCDPDIVILDEPFSGLDPVNSRILQDVVMELIGQNKIVIFSSHQMSYVEEFCKDIVIINKGDVVLSGDLDNIKREFGKNQLVVSAVDKTLDDLENIINEHMSDILEITGRTKEELIIKNVADVSRKQILSKFISENIEIERFETYKPSLNDIFVSKVGDADEKEAAE